MKNAKGVSEQLLPASGIATSDEIRLAQCASGPSLALYEKR